MIKIKRLITTNAFSYQNVELVDWDHEQKAKGVRKYVTNNDLIQIALRTSDGKIHILTDWMVGVVEIRRMKPPACAEKVDQVVLSGEISYSPVWLIEERQYNQYKIPQVFDDQVAFVAENNLYICHQYALIEIVLSSGVKQWKKNK